MECRHAAEALLAFASTGTPPPELDAAQAHVAGCPVCQARLAYLPAALAEGGEDRLTCAECAADLAEFLAARDAGRDQQPEWADLARHLAACPHCSAALGELALLRDHAETLVAATPPQPQLAFVRPQAEPAWRVDSLGQLLVALARALRPVRPAAGLKQGGAITLAEGAVNDALADLELQLAVEGRPDAETVTLLVTVTLAGRAWPDLGGSAVTLLRDGAELERQFTDAFGSAAFDGLAAAELARYSLVVRPAAGGGVDA